MAAGKRHTRIRIEREVVTRDAVGGEVKTWTRVADAWAEPRPLLAREYAALPAAQADVTTRFFLDYFAGVSSAMRVTTPDGTVHEIVEAINVGGRGFELELRCRAAAGEA